MDFFSCLVIIFFDRKVHLFDQLGKMYFAGGLQIDGCEYPVIIAVRDLNFRIKQRDENSLKTIFDSGKDKEMNFLQIAYEEESYSQLLENDNLNNFSWLYVRNLNVHHKYYQENKKPWEYEDEALETLCWDCHEKLHKDGQVKVYDKNMNEIGVYNCCKRCHGIGWFPEFTHIQSGLCFRCKGACYEELIN